MKLVDMAYSPAEMKARKQDYAHDTAPAYPWGLSLHFDGPELKKLGITELPKVGYEYHLHVVAKVTGVNQSLRENEDDSTSIACQITQIEIMADEGAADEKKEPPAAETKEPKAPAKRPAGKGGSVMSMNRAMPRY